MTGCDIMGLTVEQFKALSDAEQLQTKIGRAHV